MSQQGWYGKHKQSVLSPGGPVPVTAIGDSISGCRYVGYAKKDSKEVKVYLLLHDKDGVCELGFCSDYGNKPGFKVPRDRVIFTQEQLENFGKDKRAEISQADAWKMKELLKEILKDPYIYEGDQEADVRFRVDTLNEANALINKYR